MDIGDLIGELSGGLVVATLVQSNTASLAKRAWILGGWGEDLDSVRAREVARVPPKWEP